MKVPRSIHRTWLARFGRATVVSTHKGRFRAYRREQVILQPAQEALRTRSRFLKEVPE